MMYKLANNLCSKPVTNRESEQKRVTITHENIKSKKKAFGTFAVHVYIKLTIMFYRTETFSDIDKRQGLIDSHQ